MALFVFTVVCPDCNKDSQVSADKKVPEPKVNCGDCLMDRVEIVQMKVVKVEEVA